LHFSSKVANFVDVVCSIIFISKAAGNIRFLKLSELFLELIELHGEALELDGW
jgi:hypothetical protein